MSTFQKNLEKVLKEIARSASLSGRKPEEISLVVVTKSIPWEKVKEAYECGCRDFGEARVQEALKKMEEFPKDIRWHFIGHLQKNKISKVLGRFVLIHSVDTPELVEDLSKASIKRGLKTSILLETNTSGERAKQGVNSKTWKEHFESLFNLQGVSIEGLMTMAPLTSEERVIRSCFSNLRHLRDDLQECAGAQATLSKLSMGMSNDFSLAIQEGATLVRIGSALFKEGENTL